MVSGSCTGISGRQVNRLRSQCPNVGSRLGHCDVTALIGEGGMGQVYQATDTKLNRQVVLKILPERDPGRLARFQREAQDPLV